MGGKLSTGVDGGSDLSTGVDALDRRFDGGIQPGRVLALVAPPESQSESLLRELMAERPTLYITTIRQREAVETDLAINGGDTGDVTVTATNETASMENEFVNRLTGSRTASLGNCAVNPSLERTYEAIKNANGERWNIIISPVNPLEHTENRNAYRETLSLLKSVALETDSLGVLHCSTSYETPALRELSLNMADIIWDLDIVSMPNSKEFQLTIPKNRGGCPVLDPISLEIKRGVYVDDSRNI